MNTASIFRKTILFAGCLMASLLTGCNSNDPIYKYEESPNLAVTSFSLHTKSDITGLDSIYFTIDLNHGIIYNADSVRRGTPVDKLVPVIKFASSVEKAVITMSGGSTRTGEVDYKKNPGDSIDFTGDVTLTVAQPSKGLSRTYAIRLNVHREVADSMVWKPLDKSNRPSRLGNPVAQKSISRNDVAFTLVEESDRTFTLAESSDIASGTWSRTTLSLPFTPQIDSFSVSETSFWILDTSGNLFTSADAVTWNATGERWSRLIGCYLDSALGIKDSDSGAVFARYPEELAATPIPESFPVSGSSNLVTLRNKWTSSPVAFMTGGKDSSGGLSGDTWAFDGRNWIILSRSGIPKVSGAAIVPYYNYRVSAAGNSMVEYDVWLLLGGLLADGNPNRTLYISYDNGVTWQAAAFSLQISPQVPPMAACDAVVMNEAKSASLAANWTYTPDGAPRKLPIYINGDTVNWECPYIYLIGGTAPDGHIYDSIWRGVLMRLTFTPVI